MVTDANWYHCNIGVISRSQVRTAVGAAAYITGTCLRDRELEASPNYEPSDYRRKGGVEQWFITAPETAPEWAFDIDMLVNEAQARDTRKNSCTARIGRFALPSATDAEGREKITHEVADFLADRYGVAVIASIHAPDRHGDDRNWHAHLWFTTREIDENGLGAKTRVLDDRKTGPQEIMHIREAVAGIINDCMEETGVDERVDHRSYRDRGVERTPMIHLGEAASALERKGIRTERGDRNRAIRESNRRLEHIEHALEMLEAERTQELDRLLAEPEEVAAGAQVNEFAGKEPEAGIEAGRDSTFAFPSAEEQSASLLENMVENDAGIIWQQAQARMQSAFASEVTRAYGEEEPQTPEEELQKNEKVWYNEFYNKAVETVHHYWSRFVNFVRGDERDRDGPGPER